MSSIDDLFADLKKRGQKAFMPFITAGDPDLEFTAAVIKALAARGCSMCEVGIPYSDPIADGPVIQASYTRALAHKVKVAEVMQMLAEVTREVEMPIVTMVSYAIVHRHGLKEFVAEAKASGVVGAIIPDLLVEESGALAELCHEQDFSLIQLVTPTTPRERAVKIAKSSTGFVYYVSVTGITGERQELPTEVVDDVSWLRTQTDLPICIGFGISQPEHVKLLAPVADGLIVGSALVRRIALAESHSRQEVLREVGDLASELIRAAE